MFRLCVSFLLVCLTATVVLAQTDFCDKSLCPAGTTHIACNNPGTWGAACPTNPAPTLVGHSIDLNQYIIALFNVKRSMLALGQISPFQPAERMATMHWAPELATSADYNVRQCQKKPDSCHNTDKFKASGQSIAEFKYAGALNSRSVEDLYAAAVDLWWSERSNANMNIINSYPGTTAVQVYVNFATMAQQYNWAVGCGMIRYTKAAFNYCLVVCNFATKPTAGKPIYVTGPTGSACTTGKSGKYPGLCTPNEVYVL